MVDTKMITADSMKDAALLGMALTVPETANLMRLCTKTVRRKIRIGELAAYKQRTGTPGRNRVLVPFWSLMAYQNKRAAELLERYAGVAKGRKS